MQFKFIISFILLNSITFSLKLAVKMWKSSDYLQKKKKKVPF